MMRANVGLVTRVVVMATLAGGTSSALACPESGSTSDGAVVRMHLTAAPARSGWISPAVTFVGDPEADEPAAVKSSSTSVVISRVDDREVKVTNRNGTISVELDGKTLEPARYRVKNGWVTVLDEKGNTITELMSGGAVAGEGVARLKLRATKPGEPLDEMLVAPVSTPPKVMLGVTTTEASTDLLEHLGLAEKSALLVGSVMKGSPAEQVGLKKGDLIVSVGGDAVSDPSALRDKIRDKNPGDELALTVFQQGQKRDIKIKLAAYDAKMFTTVPNITRVGPDANLEELQGLLGGQNQQHEQLARELAQLSERLAQLRGGEDGGRLKELQEEAQRLVERSRQAQGHAFTFTLPRTPDAPGAPMVITGGGTTDARLRRVEERLARIEELLEKLAEKQDKDKPKDEHR